jgi:hypothetical protein
MAVIGSYRDSPQLHYKGLLTADDLERLIKHAIQRDDRLTRKEYWAKAQAQTECELGPNWWTRGHP